MTDWYFDSNSNAYGSETFGPYDTFDEAMQAMGRVQSKASALKDGVQRLYSAPYDDSVLPTDEVTS
jgi:X-X-X-Leu-X-X-Gly heptad repeat protein